VDVLAEPDAVAGMVAFLASEEAFFITGQTIAVDGGLSRN
jgi:NAD(P)-dependent dehydrogenase (short-subunit alcohol dehydrogenase family)